MPPPFARFDAARRFFSRAAARRRHARYYRVFPYAPFDASCCFIDSRLGAAPQEGGRRREVYGAPSVYVDMLLRAAHHL